MKKFVLLCLSLFLVLATAVSAALNVVQTTVPGSATVGAGTSGTVSVTVENTVATATTLAYDDLVFTGTGSTPATATFTSTGITGSPTATVTGGSTATPSSTPVTVTIPVPSTATAGTYSGTLLTVKDSADATIKDTVTVTLTVSTTHDVTVDGGEIVVSLDYAVLREDDSNITVTKDFTVKNTGAFTETVTLSLTNLNAGVKNSALSTSSFTLAQGESKSVTFSGAMPVTFDAGVKTLPSFGKLRISFNSNTQTRDVDMKASAKTMLDIVKLEADVGDERDSSVDDGEKISKDASRGDKILLTFEVKNIFDDNYDEGDIENVEVNVKIDDADEDDFGDSIDEDSADFDVNAGDREKDVTVEFDVPDDAEDGTYTFTVTATGEDGNGAEHTATMKFDLEVNLERDDVRITRVDLTPSTVECSRDASMSIQVKNHGSKDQDDVSLQIDSDSAALGIDEDFKFAIEESGGDDVVRRQFSFNVDDSVPAGAYPVEVRVFIDGDELQDEERTTLTVKSCAAPSTAGSTSNDSTTVVIQPAAGASDAGTPSSDTTPSSTTGGAVADIVFDTEETAFTQSPLFWVVLALANVVVLGAIVFALVKVIKK